MLRPFARRLVLRGVQPLCPRHCYPALHRQLPCSQSCRQLRCAASGRHEEDVGSGRQPKGRADPGRATGSRDPGTEGIPAEKDWSLWRDVAVLSGSQLMLNMGFSQMVPVLPLFVAQMGGSMNATGVGLVMSAPSLAMLFLNVPLGRVCDTVGRKPLMYAGTAMTAVGALLTGLTGSLGLLVPCRLLVGAGICASSTGSSAYMADLTDRCPEHRAKIMGINQAIAGSVWVVGPAIGGWLAETYGYQNSFFIASFGAAACSVGYLHLPETLQRVDVPKQGPASCTSSASQSRSSSFWAGAQEHFRGWLADIQPLIGCGNQQALVALSLVPALRWACFSTVITLHAASEMCAGPMEIGFMFTALALSQGLAMPFGAYLADKSRGAKLGVVMPAGLLSTVSFAAIAGATNLQHLQIAMALQGFCAGFTVPAQGAFRAEVTPQALRGQAMSLERQAGSIVSLLGPVSMGLLADCTGTQAPILATACLMAGCHIFYLLRVRPS